MRNYLLAVLELLYCIGCTDDGGETIDWGTDSDTQGGYDADSDTDADGDADSDSDADTDSDTDADGDADSDADADADADADSDADADGCIIRVTDSAPGWASMNGGATGAGTDLSNAVSASNMSDLQDAIGGGNIVLVEPGTWNLRWQRRTRRQYDPYRYRPGS